MQDSTKIPRGSFPWRKSFCVATLSPASHQTFICENAKEDIRQELSPFSHPFQYIPKSMLLTAA